jgi:hypothetical protein
LEHPQFIASTDMNADSPLSVFESDRKHGRGFAGEVCARRCNWVVGLVVEEDPTLPVV